MRAIAAREGRSRLSHDVVAAGIFLGGLSLSLVLFYYARAWERSSVRTELNSRVHQRVELVQSKVLQSMEVLHGLAALFETRHEVSRKEFALYVRDALDRQPELHALVWTPRVPRNQREKYEAAARKDGFANFRISVRDANGRDVPAGEADAYYPVYYIEPGDHNRPAIGFDLASNDLRRNALNQAWDNDGPAATSPVRLVQDSVLGIIVYVPVKERTASGKSPQPAGFCSAVFGVEDLLGASAKGLEAEGLEFELTDPFKKDGPLISRPAKEPIVAMFHASAPVDVAGQQWVVTLRPTESFVAEHSNGHAMAILAAGVVISALLAGYVRRALAQRHAVEQRVRVRTAQLSREVAERKRAEDLARIAESNYRGIFENSVEGIFQTTLDGRYLRANRALARVYGYETPEQLIDHLADIAVQLYVRQGRREEFTEQIQKHGFVADFESEVRQRDGSIIWISENARAVRDPSGEVIYYEGMVVDITARKHAEESLSRARAELEQRVQERTAALALSNEALQAEITVRQRAEDAAASASRAKSEFLANISHEIRTPMNAILGYAQLLHRDRALDGGQRDSIETIMNSGRHLIELIDDVLDISKIEAGRAEMRSNDVDLRAMAIGIAGMFRHKCEQKGIALRVECHPQLPTRVRVDERKLRQVLINLLGNAVKFTRQGSVKLRIGADAGDESRVHSTRIWAFEVCDTGDGIPLEAQERIFEPFQQGSAGQKWGGTGLGLAIARRLVELIGGNLGLDSAPGQGSRFYFSLALAGGAGEAPQARREIAALSPGQTVRAMVVDDVPENRHVLGRLLMDVGCQVVTATGAEESFRLLESSPFDIVFLDVLMPGMDGVEAARQIRDRHGDSVRLVATSASAFSHEQAGYRAAGLDGFVAKPLRCDQLYACLSTLLNVKFDYSPDADDEPSDLDLLDDDSLPPSLRKRLSAAAELYSVTEIRQCIEEIERLVPESQQLCAHLRRRVHDYDMSGILRLLNSGAAGPIPGSIEQVTSGAGE